MGTVVHPRAPLADGNRAGTGDLIRARLNTAIDAGGQQLTNRDVLRIEGWQGQDAEVVRRLPGGGWSARFLVPGLLPGRGRRIALRGQYPRGAGPDRRYLARAGHRHAVPAVLLRRDEPRAASRIWRTW